MEAATKARPIIFSAPMVRALIDGRKTQTRRIVKPKPLWVYADQVPVKTKDADPRGAISCPFGVPGDKLYVREKFGYANAGKHRVIVYAADESAWHIVADEGGEGDERSRGKRVDRSKIDPVHRWYPSIHMPRWASRITLTITNVRVERVQDISDADVVAEGTFDAPVNEDSVVRIRTVQQYRGKPELCNDRAFASRARFMVLWDSIHGTGAWDRNDWIWALTFTTEVRK